MSESESDRSRDLAPDVQLFVREDVSKAENRVNLALLNILMVPAFRHWLLGRLGLPPDCVMYPPQNVRGLRPDLVAVDAGGEVKAWIEIELAGENSAQLAEYRTRLSQPVKSVVGPRDAGSDVSLEELAEIASDCLQDVLDKQQRKIVQIFVDLVSELGGRASAWDYTPPGDAVREERLVVALSAQLGSALVFGKPPFPPGQLQVSTITQEGWTLRVYARNANSSVSVLWKQALNGPTLRLPSYARLIKYLRQDAVDSYRQFFYEGFGLDIKELGEEQSFPVDEAELLRRLDGYVAALRLFLTPLMTSKPTST